MTTIHKFEAVLERPDMKGAWTFIRVPFSVEEKFDTRARVSVRGSVNGVEFRSSLMPQGGGTHILVVNRELRDKAGVDVGDTASFEVALDTEPRVVEVPDELRRALQANHDARNAFDRLSYSHQKEYADFVSEAKRPTTRERRAARSVEMLTEGHRLKS